MAKSALVFPWPAAPLMWSHVRSSFELAMDGLLAINYACGRHKRIV